jgi:hypothetical protein
MYIPNTKWTWAFFATAATQAVIALVLEAYVPPHPIGPTHQAC